MFKIHAAVVAVTVYRELGGLVHRGGGSAAVDRRRLAENGGRGQPELIGGRGLDNVNRVHDDLFILGVFGSLRGGHVHKEDENHGGGLITMTNNKNKNNDVDRRVDKLETKFEMFMQESRDMRQEMRDRDNQRAEDMREIRTSISNMQNRIEDMGKHVRNLSLTAMGAIATMVVTVIISLLKS